MRIAPALALASAAVLTLGLMPTSHAAPAPNTDYQIQSLDGGLTTGTFRVTSNNVIEVSLTSRSRDWMTTRVENNVAGQQAQRYNSPTDETTVFRIQPVQNGWNVFRVIDSNGTVRADAVAWKA